MLCTTTDLLTISTTCPLCGAESKVECSASGYARWERGELIQNALPTLTSSDREALMTGICDTCWNESFGE
jgi:hypothetical protein